MKKQHDAISLANELEGSSAFFQERQVVASQPTTTAAPAGRPLAPPITRPTDTSTTPPSGRSTDGAAERPASRAEHRPRQRSLQRRSFEFYVDQLEILKAWSLQAQLRGEKTSMSEMLRSALDTYLAAQRSTDDPTKRPADPSAREPEV
ncbi:hypothetical protein BH23CHL2_BH23CHL2_19800 [soil metagenome]